MAVDVDAGAVVLLPVPAPAPVPVPVAVEGANAANAAFMPAMFLMGERSNMRTMPMLKIWTPPPDM